MIAGRDFEVASVDRDAALAAGSTPPPGEGPLAWFARDLEDATWWLHEPLPDGSEVSYGLVLPTGVAFDALVDIVVEWLVRWVAGD